MAYDADRQVVLMFGGGGRPNEAFYDLWAWNGSTWQLLSNQTPDGFYGAPTGSMAFDPASHRPLLYEFPGGVPSDRFMWWWDGAKWIKQPTGNLELPLDGFNMVTDTTASRLLLFFGEDVAPGGSARAVRGDGWSWNGSGWVKLAAREMPPGRVFGMMAYDAARQQVVAYGGRDGSNQVLSDTWTWDGSTWTRRA